MTHIEQFIKDAIEGGWGKANDWRPEITSYYDFIGFYGQAGYNQILLDKDAWIAVGKTRGWDSRITFYQTFTKVNEENNDPWRLYWHIFIDHIADGKSIEDALAAII